MTKKQTCIFLGVVAVVIAALIVGIVLTDGLYVKDSTIQDTMKDAVLHEGDKISLFGLAVNPGLISAFVVTGIILVFAAVVRIFVIPRFKLVPGKFQMLLEQAVGLFDGQRATARTGTISSGRTSLPQARTSLSERSSSSSAFPRSRRRACPSSCPRRSPISTGRSRWGVFPIS